MTMLVTIHVPKKNKEALVEIPAHVTDDGACWDWLAEMWQEPTENVKALFDLVGKDVGTQLIRAAFRKAKKEGRI